jgi:hypothetical protein
MGSPRHRDTGLSAFIASAAGGWSIRYHPRMPRPLIAVLLLAATLAIGVGSPLLAVATPCSDECAHDDCGADCSQCLCSSTQALRPAPAPLPANGSPTEIDPWTVSCPPPPPPREILRVPIPSLAR